MDDWFNTATAFFLSIFYMERLLLLLYVSHTLERERERSEAKK